MPGDIKTCDFVCCKMGRLFWRGCPQPLPEWEGLPAHVCELGLELFQSILVIITNKV